MQSHSQGSRVGRTCLSVFRLHLNPYNCLPFSSPNIHNVSLIFLQTIDYEGWTESEYSLYLSYDCEGDQDRTHVRQSSYTCAAPATTTTTTTAAAVNSAVSFVEVSSDCPHDPGSSCYLQSKTGMDWHQAGKVEKFYFTSTFI